MSSFQTGPEIEYLPRRRRSAGAVSSASVADWTLVWTLGTSQRPAAILDFVNNQYYDGVSNAAPMSSLVQNATRDAGGLICNAGNINVINAFLTAMKNAGGATVALEVSGGNLSGNYGLLSMSSGGPDSAFIANSAGSMDAFNGTSCPGPALPDYTKNGTYSSAWNNAGNISISTLGLIASFAKNFSAVTAAQLGSYNGGSLWPGRIRTVAIYTGQLSNQYLKNISWPGVWNKPFNGNTGVGSFGSSGADIDAGATLASYFKSATPWSMVCGHNSSAASSLKVLFTNVHNGGAPWYGHEAYINTTGKMRVSIFSNWAGGAASTNLIQVEGSTNLFDTKWHVIGVSYDGSQVAAGIKIYVDGVAETLTYTFDNLTGASDTSIGTFNVGGQYNNFCCDYMDFFAMSKIARSAAYFAAISATRTRPSVDANTLVQYEFSEGSGTTTADHSGNGYNGTFVPGAGALPWI